MHFWDDSKAEIRPGYHLLHGDDPPGSAFAISTSSLETDGVFENTLGGLTIATPRVLGHELRLTANLCLARDASVN